MKEIKCSGALFYSRATDRFLFLQKANGKHSGTWGLVGGTNLKFESPWQGLQREIIEEIGELPDIVKVIPLETFVSDDVVFYFHTYLCVVDQEFIPYLSDEHMAWSWAKINNPPKPIHGGLRTSLSSKIIERKISTVLSYVDDFDRIEV